MPVSKVCSPGLDAGIEPDGVVDALLQAGVHADQKVDDALLFSILLGDQRMRCGPRSLISKYGASSWRSEASYWNGKVSAYSSTKKSKGLMTVISAT
jgi:hypothetical protein